MASRTLQQQGVPIRDRLTGPQGRTNATPQQRQSSPPRSRSVARKASSNTGTTSSNGQTSSPGIPNPASLGKQAGDSASGVGTLEAEFLVAIGLLVLLLFSGTDSYANKIMSLMKRGSLACLLFFLLALISSTGPKTAKWCKAFGALIIVAILITSDVGSAFKDIDGIIKNDWAGSSETGGDVSADSGTAATGTGSPANATAQAENVFEKIPGLISGALDNTIPEISNPISKPIVSAITSLLGKL